MLEIESADPALIEKLLHQYAPVRLDLDVGRLADGDRRALGKLVECSSWIDRIYWKQRSVEGWGLRQRVSESSDGRAPSLRRLLDINFGPWDTFDDDRPFCGDRKRPPGGDLYPPDLGREELDRYLAQHPEQRPALLSHTTLVRREGSRLVTIPYEDAYAEELAQVAKCLVEASEFAGHEGFRAFLRARAKGLVSGNLRESDALWIGMADSPIDIAIGPYEVYDDALMGRKTSYEATVLVRHPLTERIRHFAMLAPDLEGEFPGAVASASARRRIALAVYDVVVTAGMSNMGGKAVAATLPNDERMRTEVGARLFLFQNVIRAKFAAILKPIAARVLGAEQIDLVSEEAFLHHTMLHEMAHAVGEGFVRRGATTTGATINEALGERYATIEECRADLVGLVSFDFLARRGAFGSGLAAKAAVTFVVSGVRTLRFGAGDDYSRTAAIILSRLLETRAIRLDSSGNLVVDVEAVYGGIADLAKTVQDIATRGDYQAAGELIGEMGDVPREIQRLLPRLEGLPVDLEFVFEDGLRGLR